MNISTANIPGPIETDASRPIHTTRMDRLIVLSGELRSRADAPAQSSEGWFNPDPLAITQLPAGRHPIRVMFAKSTMRASNKTVSEKRVLVVYRILNSVPRDMKDLNVAFEFAWHQITLEQAGSFCDKLTDSTNKPATIALYITTLRGLLRACRQVGLIDRTRLELLLDELNPPRIGVQDVGRAISPGEIAALFVAAENRDPWRQSRDRAILAIFSTTGMRRCELLDLKIDDWDREKNTLSIARGKGENPRTVPLHPETDTYIADWVANRGDHDGPLFHGCRTQPTKPPAVKTINPMLARLATKAGIEPITSHDFRRTVVTTLLRSTDPAVVARLVGHRSLDTTFRYDKTPMNLQRSAVNSLAVPGFDSLKEAK